MKCECPDWRQGHSHAARHSRVVRKESQWMPWTGPAHGQCVQLGIPQAAGAGCVTVITQARDA